MTLSLLIYFISISYQFDDFTVLKDIFILLNQFNDAIVFKTFKFVDLQLFFNVCKFAFLFFDDKKNY